MRHLARRALELTPQRRALLDFLLQEEGLDATSTQRIPPREQADSIPLSFAQQRLWFLDQLEPGRPTYNIPAAFRLRGPLDVTALEHSLNEIVRRHEALRTTFQAREGRPVQAIVPSSPFSLRVVNLSGLPGPDREAEALRLASAEAQSPFDLIRGPLVRCALLRVSGDDHVLLLTVHHIVFDGWSMGILERELSLLHEAFSTGKPSPLPDLPIQYADFAVWQRQWLQGEVLEKQLAYWRQQLVGLTALSLPTDRPRPAVQSYRGARQSLILSRSLRAALKAVNCRGDVTLFMVLLAAFKVLLHRHTGQDDIVVGSPIAGRNRTEIEGLIGFFVNTLVLRTNLSGNPTFRELLARVREVTLGAYAHQDLPFERLVEELHPDRNLSRTPLFQVFFNMLGPEDNGPELPGLTVERFLLPEQDSKFDLTLYAAERSEELHLQLVYNADLFESDRMMCLLQQFRHLLEQVAATPDRPIRSYSLVTPESRALLPDPGSALAEPHQELVASLLASWASRTPGQTAIRQGGRTWSYGELVERARAIARALRAGGLERGDVVGVQGQRSFGLIASMTGVLWSGGVLLPIDPDLPSQRKQVMLREAGARRLLCIGTRGPEDAQLGQDLALETLSVDAGTGRAVDVEMGVDLAEVPLPELDGDDPAYIFFTSGTTGVPKGVLGRHKGLSHFLDWQRQTFAIGPQDRSAQLTGLSFDVVLRDVFLVLTSGGTLCLPDDASTLGPEGIVTWLAQERISVLHTVPSLAQHWLAHLSSQVSMSSMRWVFFAGEPLTENLVRQWRAAFPGCAQIVNLYGPTETTLAKCFYIVPPDCVPGIQPAGWPLPQTQALVRAEDGGLCGVGEPGEIVLRTPFRTRGYINAPEETRMRFIRNALRNDEHDILYRTGDCGRYRPDGSLDILGRLDDQVKIRGVRIEPAEVTATLARHPAVRTCVVVTRKDEQGETCLAAYVVPTDRDGVAVSELRSYLGEHLPSAMVPSAFVFLDALPLMPNGKVNRQALPVPARSHAELEATYVAARTPTEKTLAALWAELLGVDRVGVRDDFFGLGGHSLLALRLSYRIESTFGQTFPVATLFRARTVEQLAKLIGPVRPSLPVPSVVVVTPGKSREAFFCLPGGGGNASTFLELARLVDLGIPFYGLQPPGLDGKEHPYRCIEDMAPHLIKEVRGVQPNGPYYLGGYSRGGRIAFEMAQQLHAQGERIALLAMFDTYAPGCPRTAPFIIRLALHARRLLSLRSDEKLRYVCGRVRSRISRVRERIRSAIRSGHSYSGAASSAVPEDIRTVHESLRRASQSYVPRPYPGRITLFRATVTPDHLGTFYDDPECGWGRIARGGVEVHPVPGTHLSIVSEPHVSVLAEALRDCILRAQEDSKAECLGPTVRPPRRNG